MFKTKLITSSILLVVFLVLFSALYSFLCFFVLVKSYRKKKKFKADLITPSILLPFRNIRCMVLIFTETCLLFKSKIFRLSVLIICLYRVRFIYFPISKRLLSQRCCLIQKSAHHFGKLKHNHNMDSNVGCIKSIQFLIKVDTLFENINESNPFFLF